MTRRTVRRQRRRRWLTHWLILIYSVGAMTPDTYADLFDNDRASVAENIGKLWGREAGLR